jgi:hypothetical protein
MTSAPPLQNQAPESVQQTHPQTHQQTAPTQPIKPSPTQPPFQPKTDYQDSWGDRLFIHLFIRKMSLALGEQPSQQGFAGVVDLSRRMMEGRSPDQQQALVAKMLNSMVPKPVLWFIRKTFSPTQWVCEANAWFAARLFPWLIGPCEVVEAEVTGMDGERRWQKSDVHIQKCRYLEESGCVGLCINLCKLPTQRFFTEQFGIPVTLTPNFEDLSCEMVFGQVPPALETEAAYQQPCLMPGADAKVPCPKVRSA